MVAKLTHKYFVASMEFVLIYRDNTTGTGSTIDTKGEAPRQYF